MPIFLIRHGETALNAARVVQTPDTPLSARGLAQADALARRLAEPGVALIVSSDLPRARMTAQRLQTTTGAPITLDPGLQERNFGDVRGQPYATLGADILSPDYDPPGGETWAAFRARVETTWTRITAGHDPAGGNLAVVTHGLVCHVLAEHCLALPIANAQRPWRNASLTVVEDLPPWVVRVLNCTTHLAGDEG